MGQGLAREITPEELSPSCLVLVVGSPVAENLLKLPLDEPRSGSAFDKLKASSNAQLKADRNLARTATRKSARAACVLSALMHARRVLPRFGHFFLHEDRNVFICSSFFQMGPGICAGRCPVFPSVALNL